MDFLDFYLHGCITPWWVKNFVPFFFCQFAIPIFVSLVKHLPYLKSVIDQLHFLDKREGSEKNNLFIYCWVIWNRGAIEIFIVWWFIMNKIKEISLKSSSIQSDLKLKEREIEIAWLTDWNCNQLSKFNWLLKLWLMK